MTTDPTETTETTDPPAAPDTTGMTNIRDFEVRLPFHRTGPDGGVQHTELRVRVPADSEDTAFLLGTGIGQHIDAVNDPETGRPWQLTSPEISVVDVDDTPSPAELAAELAHWKRVVAALAAKLPLLLQVSGAEYEAARPDGIAVMPIDPESGTVAFIVPSVMDEIAQRHAAGFPSDGDEPMPEWS